MASWTWTALLLLMLKAQNTIQAQTVNNNSTYHVSVNISEGIVATSRHYVCDDVVSPQYVCPDTSWTLLPDSDGPFCLRHVDIPEAFDNATESCWAMGGRLVTITTEKRQRALEDFLPFRYTLEPWIGLRRNYSYGEFYWEGLDQHRLNYTNANNYYSDLINRCCGYDCVHLTYPYRKWTGTSCSENRPYICERDKLCKDGFVGDNCDQVCHCYGEPCQGGQPCKYGCESGWTGPYCYTRTRRAEIIYYCVNSSSEGRYALVRINPFGRKYETVQLTDEAGHPQPWCSGSEMWYDDTGVYSVKIPVTRGNEWQVGFTCGGNKTGDNSYKWQLALHEKSGVMLALDRRMELSCDFNEADNMVLTQSQSFAVEGGDLPPVEKPVNSREFVSLEVTDPYTGQALKQARLGANVQLRMKLTITPGISAQGVSPYDCIVSSGDGLYSLVLTDSDGCPASGSTIISELRGHNGTVMTDPFELFTFPGHSSLQITCSFQFCFTREDSLCNERCSAKRRNRLHTTKRSSYPWYGDHTTAASPYLWSTDHRTTSPPYPWSTDYRTTSPPYPWSTDYRTTSPQYPWSTDFYNYLGTTSYYYWGTTYYDYWRTTWYRRKREANAPESATAVINIIREDTSMAATNTGFSVAWTSLVILVFLRGFTS